MRRRFKFKAFLALLGLFVAGIVLPLVINAPMNDNARPVKGAPTQQQFIQTLAPIAQELSKDYGVQPAILLAQAAYETNYGSSILAVKYHNLYSLVAQAGQDKIRLKDQIYQNGKWQSQAVSFAIYPTWKASMEAYLERLHQGTWGKTTYKDVASTTDYKVAAGYLGQSSYSTDPNYASELIKIIESNKLTQYNP